MRYEIPPEQFNAAEAARQKLTEAARFHQAAIDQFQQTYESFWGVSGIDGEAQFYPLGSRHSVAEMQQIVDAMGPAAAAVMADAAAFRDFVESATPGVLPVRYHSPAFNLTSQGSGVVVGDLLPEWQPLPQHAK